MIRLKYFWLLLGGLSLFFSCKEEFEMDYEVQDMAPILVVEGFINAGSTESHYKLSYAQPMKEMEAEDPEFDHGDDLKLMSAMILVSENGQRYYSEQKLMGDMVIKHPVLDPNQRYKLQIQVGMEVFESEFVDVKVSQPISKLEWEDTGEGVEILVSTEDLTNSTQYYRWEYVETWRYSSIYMSNIILEGESARYRNSNERIDVCYISENSSAIKIATSESLSTDAIYRFPLTLIPNLSDRLSSRYSILARQIPISEESYIYWSQIRESSENLGDIFGPMPSELRSNIACLTNPEHHVIGMVEAAQVAEKRLYINKEDLNRTWRVIDSYYGGCLLREEPIRQALPIVIGNPGFLLVDELYRVDGSPFPSHYSYSSVRCVDCRVKGGEFDPPAFWQE